MFGQDYVDIEHFDEGISANEITYQAAFYAIKAKEEKDAAKRK